MPKADRRKQTLEFAQKLVLNQWLISLFGVDPLAEGYERGKKPFHKLVEHLRMTREGMDADGFHHFYHELKDGDFFRMGGAKVSAAELQAYEVLQKKFLEEGRLLSKLTHPRIVRVFDLAIEPKSVFLEQGADIRKVK